MKLLTDIPTTAYVRAAMLNIYNLLGAADTVEGVDPRAARRYRLEAADDLRALGEMLSTAGTALLVEVER